MEEGRRLMNTTVDEFNQKLEDLRQPVLAELRQIEQWVKSVLELNEPAKFWLQQ
jgi:hypothetical protein